MASPIDEIPLLSHINMTLPTYLCLQNPCKGLITFSQTLICNDMSQHSTQTKHQPCVSANMAGLQEMLLSSKHTGRGPHVRLCQDPCVSGNMSKASHNNTQAGVPIRMQDKFRINVSKIFNRPGVAGAVLQTPP